MSIRIQPTFNRLNDTHMQQKGGGKDRVKRDITCPQTSIDQRREKHRARLADIPLPAATESVRIEFKTSREKRGSVGKFSACAREGKCEQHRRTDHQTSVERTHVSSIGDTSSRRQFKYRDIRQRVLITDDENETRKLDLTPHTHTHTHVHLSTIQMDELRVLQAIIFSVDLGERRTKRKTFDQGLP